MESTDLTPMKPICVDATLPANMFMRRKIEAPVAAASNLAKVAELDLLRSTPFSAHEIVWVLSKPELVQNKVVATQWVGRRDALEALRNRLESLGLSLRYLRIEGFDQLPPFRAFAREVNRKARPWRRANSALLIAAGLFVLAALTFPAVQATQARRVAERELLEMRTQAVTLRAEIETLRELEVERAALIDLIELRPRLVGALRELSVALPDSTWVSDISFRQDGLSLSGHSSASAPDLVLQLGESQTFRNPQLSGPVSLSANGNEQFDMTLEFR